jgi:hypothetical protein
MKKTRKKTAKKKAESTKPATQEERAQMMIDAGNSSREALALRCVKFQDHNRELLSQLNAVFDQPDGPETEKSWLRRFTKLKLCQMALMWRGKATKSEEIIEVKKKAIQLRDLELKDNAKTIALLKEQKAGGELLLQQKNSQFEEWRFKYRTIDDQLHRAKVEISELQHDKDTLTLAIKSIASLVHDGDC